MAHVLAASLCLVQGPEPMLHAVLCNDGLKQGAVGKPVGVGADGDAAVKPNFAESTVWLH